MKDSHPAKELLTEAADIIRELIDGGCDHSAGICYCREIGVMEALRAAVEPAAHQCTTHGDGECICLGARYWMDRALRAERHAEPPSDALSHEQHIANEWADMATNGIQWLRNIRDGISTPVEALAEMESNCKRIQALGVSVTKSAAPVANPCICRSTLTLLARPDCPIHGMRNEAPDETEGAKRG